jgi:hypothetical protein
MISRLSPRIDLRRLFILVCSCASLCSHAEEHDDPAFPAYVLQVEDRVRVQGEVVETTKDLQTGTDGQGGLTLYSKAGKPVKMILEIGLSNHFVTKTFFYDEGSLVLCVNISRFFKWDAEKQELDYDHTGEQYEERYYFKDGVLACWLTIHDPKSNETYEMPKAGEKQCLEESAFFLKVAASKGKYADVSAYTTKGKPVFTSGDER